MLLSLHENWRNNENLIRTTALQLYSWLELPSITEPATVQRYIHPPYTIQELYITSTSYQCSYAYCIYTIFSLKNLVNNYQKKQKAKNLETKNLDTRIKIERERDFFGGRNTKREREGEIPRGKYERDTKSPFLEMYAEGKEVWSEAVPRHHKHNSSQVI